MGLLDSAKEKLSSSFSDETVSMVSFDEEKAEPEKKARPQREKPKRERPSRPQPRTVKAEEPEEEKPRLSKGANTNKRRWRDRDKSEPTPEVVEEEAPTPPKDEVEDEPIVYVAEEHHEEERGGSAFAVEDDAIDNFLMESQEKYEKEQAKKYEGVPDLKVRDRHVQDVLEVMDIPPTFAIETDVFLPEDIDQVVFDLQAPYGYEQGQVELFVRQARNSVKRYVDLLKIRNEHVAKLASTVDKLQVDANNLRHETEIASGINIMPSYDSDNMEAKYYEMKAENNRLKEQLNDMHFGGGLTAQERNRYNDLQDQTSILRRENEELKDEIYNLKSQLALIQEEMDEVAAGTMGDHAYMPSVAVEEDVEDIALPNPMGEEEYGGNAVEKMSSSAGAPQRGSAFYVDDDGYGGGIELLNDNGTTESVDPSTFSGEGDEDEDELDRLMKDWNN